VRVVTYADWQCLSDLEESNAQGTSRPRVKFTEIETMLAALDQATEQTPTASGD
jgi:hypothetical protein